MHFSRSSNSSRLHFFTGLSLFASSAAFASLTGCSGAESNSSSDSTATNDAPLAWVTPDSAEVVGKDEPVELAVLTHDASAKVVHFQLDGREVFACDPTADSEDCRLGDTWRYTTTLAAGHHVMTASFTGASGDVTASRDIEVLDAVPEASPEALPFRAGEDTVGAEPAPSLDLGATADPETISRGYLDPNRGYHHVFGGVYWAVSSQHVAVRSEPFGSVSAARSCMHRYGASIRHWADHFHMSRGSVVATAIAESNCTDPRGSSDGLSSGPMQVTASTCSALTGLSRTSCRVRMYSSPDFSFYVGTKYMGSSYQVRQHMHDPPKIAAAYNAGSVRAYYGNRWHMLVTGNHIERWVGAYNAYRSWERTMGIRALDTTAKELPIDDLHDEDRLAAVVPTFDGAHVAAASDLPVTADEGATVFVGDFAHRDGHFYVRAGGTWTATTQEGQESEE